MADADSITRLNAALEGRYRIERELGAGGMATIYLAEDLRHGRRVALKVLRPELATALGPERFLREIETIARLTHPHILPLHDSGEADGLLFYVMPYVEGETLRERLEREGALPIEEALQITVECAKALEHAHREGIIHRDLKPANILFSGGQPVVADFGIGRAVEDMADREGLTRTGVSLGTVGYMSPEQASGEKVDVRADVYALGCVLYEMLTGERAFTGRTGQAVMARQLTEGPPMASALRERVPEPVEQVLQKALQRNPADRHRTAADLGKALEAARERHRAGVREAGGELISRSVRMAALPGLRRRPSWRVAVPTFFVIVALAAWLVFLRPTLRQPVTEDVIAVLPFSVGSTGDLDYLREGMVELLSVKLDGADGLRAISGQTVLRGMGDAEPGPLDPATGQRIATRLGARWFVIGTVVAAGERASLSASLYDAGAEEVERVSLAEVEVEVDDGFFRSVDLLSARLLAGRLGGGIPDAAATTTSSFAAFREYLVGERAIRERRFREAQTALRRAIEIDSAFALAHYRMASASSWVPPHEEYRPSLYRAQAHAEQLTPRYRELVELRIAVESQEAGAELRLRDFVRRYPDEPEGWAKLGEHLFHLNGAYGRSPVEARQPLERAWALDPNSRAYVTHLIEIALAEGRFTYLDTLAGRLGEGPVSLQILRADALGSVAEPEELLGDWRTHGLNWYFAGLLTFYGSEAVLSPLRLRVAATADTTGAEGAHLPARIAAAFGQLALAERTLRRFGGFDALAFRTHLATLPLIPPIRPTLERLRDELGSSEALEQASWDRLGGVPIPAEAVPMVRVYLEGLVAAKLGDANSGREAVRRLGGLDGQPPLREVSLELSRSLEAELALADGRSVEALTRLVAADPEGASRSHIQGSNGGAVSDFFPPVRHRFMTAEALAASGRDAEAIAWLTPFTQYHTMALLPFVPLAHLRLGDLLSATDPEQAARHYRRFLDLWSEADPELQPLVEHARLALEAIIGVPEAP